MEHAEFMKQLGEKYLAPMGAKPYLPQFVVGEGVILTAIREIHDDGTPGDGADLSILVFSEDQDGIPNGPNAVIDRVLVPTRNASSIAVYGNRGEEEAKIGLYVDGRVYFFNEKSKKIASSPVDAFDIVQLDYDTIPMDTAYITNLEKGMQAALGNLPEGSYFCNTSVFGTMENGSVILAMVRCGVNEYRLVLATLNTSGEFIDMLVDTIPNIIPDIRIKINSIIINEVTYLLSPLRRAGVASQTSTNFTLH